MSMWELSFVVPPNHGKKSSSQIGYSFLLSIPISSDQLLLYELIHRDFGF